MNIAVITDLFADLGYEFADTDPAVFVHDGTTHSR